MVTRPQGNQNTELGDTINVADLSEDTKDVLRHFGLEAPDRLNQYSIALEDALIEQVRKVAAMKETIKNLKAQLKEYQATNFNNDK